MPAAFSSPDLTHLLELYEYKVADLYTGREPKGGLRSVRDLRRTLLGLSLPAPLLRRLVRADRLYLQCQNTPPTFPDQAPANLWCSLVSPYTDETQAWNELQLLVWHTDLMQEMHELTQQLRQEPDRPMLRVLYAVTENAERAERRIMTPFAVPPPGDPLVSLQDSEVVRQLTCTLGDMLLLPEGRKRVWHALEQVHAEPHPGQEPGLPFPAGTAAEQAAVRERPRLRAAAQQLQQWLEPRLNRVPDLLGGSGPQHAILYAQDPQSALPAPLETSDLLCIHLGGLQRLTSWQGLKLSWRSLGPNWQLLAQDLGEQHQTETNQAGQPHSDQEQAVTGQIALLRPELPPSERRLLLRIKEHQVEVFFCDDYVLLRHRDDERQQRRLAQLAAQGRALALLLDRASEYAFLRLARALVKRLRGGPRHQSDSSARYTGLSPEERLHSARRTLDSLLFLLPQTQVGVVEQALRAAQHSLQLSSQTVTLLHQVIHQAAFIPETLTDAQSNPTEPTFLNPNGVFVRLPLSHQPLEFRLPGERLLSLKHDYRGELVLLLPGHPAVSGGPLLVLPLHDLSVVVVVVGSEVAVCTLRPPLPNDEIAARLH